MMMPTNMEMRIMQKNTLHDLLVLKMEMERENSGANLKGLIRLINKNKTLMEQEDVALVEKMVAELK
jgi:hypothetical protein